MIMWLGFLGTTMALQADDSGYDDPQCAQKQQKNYEYYEDYIKELKEAEGQRSPEEVMRRAFAPYLRRN
jgi:hypothetical protein